MTRLAIALTLLLLSGCAYNDNHVNDWAKSHPELLREQFKYED